MSNLQCKIIVLVISCPGHNSRWDTERCTWLRIASQLPPFIRVHLLECGSTSKNEYILDCPHADSYIPGIYNKTIFGIKCTLARYPNAQYIIRTNLSTFICWSRLLDYLSVVQPTFTGVRVNRQQWVNGWGIVMNRTIASFLVSEQIQKDIDVTVAPDDVLIGKVLAKHGFLCMLEGTSIRDYPIISYVWNFKKSLESNVANMTKKPDCIFVRLYLPDFDFNQYRAAVCALIGMKFTPWRSRVPLVTIGLLRRMHSDNMKRIIESKKIKC